MSIEELLSEYFYVRVFIYVQNGKMCPFCLLLSMAIIDNVAVLTTVLCA